MSRASSTTLTVSEEYGTEADLAGRLQDFIHRYVDVSPLFEKIAS